MTKIGLRHQADLDGKLTAGAVPTCIQVAVTADVAITQVAQHLLWMLVNLLARQTPEISELELLIPAEIKPIDRLSPLVPAFPGGASDLRTALMAAIKSVNPTMVVRFAPEPSDKTNSRVFVRVGPGEFPEAGLFDRTFAATAVGWSGCISQYPVKTIGSEGHPIGAYVAACLCAGEVFKFIRTMHPEAGEFATTLWLDAFNFEIGNTLPTAAAIPPTLDTPFIGIPGVVAGVGAVANAFLQVFYALPFFTGQLTLIDSDLEGITEHNLNRYVMVGQSQIGQKKASTIANMLGKVGITAQGFDGTWQDWAAKRAGSSTHPLDLVISVVDNNEARHAIQNMMPHRILGASTKEMRAQVNYYNFSEGSPCLRCRNPTKQAPSDASIINRLKGLTSGDLSHLAETEGVSITKLKTFLTDPQAHCGMISGDQLQKFATILNPDTDSAEWSVGFVSALAGILLAAEYLKKGLNSGIGNLDAVQNAFRFQFWRPEASDSNRIFSTAPQAGCLCQNPIFQQLRGKK